MVVHRLASLTDVAFDKPVIASSLFVAIALVTWLFQRTVYRLYLHPLSKYPGPTAAVATTAWKAYIECVLNRSFSHVLRELHERYGEVVRVGPNELHFSNPQAYHDIYNNKNRWDKDWKLYHSFNEDRSSFGFITYKEAKERKDVLNRMFSQKAVSQAEGLILDKIDALCKAFDRQTAAGKPSDLYWAFRCMTMDIVTYLCFGNSVDAINAEGFRAPIIVAMDASYPVFVRFKHSFLYKDMILHCPPKLSKVISPSTRGLVDMQLLIKAQIQDLVQHPDKLDYLPHNMTIYHCLMDKEAYRSGTVPSEGSLYEETQALLVAGSDTTGNALMVGSFHLLKDANIYQRFKSEIQSAWAQAGSVGPSMRVLETLPYLNAVIKESLRLSVGVTSGLPRVVPEAGATIAGVNVPGGTVVSCSPTFLHFSDELFPEPYAFRPDRWLENPGLDNWLVPFSRGPRMCLGINLAWMELRLTFAHVFHRYDMELASGPDKLDFRDCFLPFWLGSHVSAHVRAA